MWSTQGGHYQHDWLHHRDVMREHTTHASQGGSGPPKQPEQPELDHQRPERSSQVEEGGLPAGVRGELRRTQCDRNAELKRAEDSFRRKLEPKQHWRRVD